MTWTQATVIRAVKAALAPARAMGFSVSGYKVSFVQGVPCVDVTIGPESVAPAPVVTGGDNEIEALKKRVGRLHRATGRP